MISFRMPSKPALYLLIVSLGLNCFLAGAAATYFLRGDTQEPRTDFRPNQRPPHGPPSPHIVFSGMLASASTRMTAEGRAVVMHLLQKRFAGEGTLQFNPREIAQQIGNVLSADELDRARLQSTLRQTDIKRTKVFNTIHDAILDLAENLPANDRKVLADALLAPHLWRKHFQNPQRPRPVE